MNSEIIEALKKLDASNDDHWTADGAPKLEALGIDRVKRGDVVKVAPHFNRTNPVIETPADKDALAKKAVELEQEKARTVIEKAAENVDKKRKVVSDIELKIAGLRRELSVALAEQDSAERELAALQGQRTQQHDIMDYLASVQRERDSACAAALAKKERELRAIAEETK